VTPPATGSNALNSSPMTDRYLDLLARTITRYRMDSPYRPADPSRLPTPARATWNTLQRVLGRAHLALVRSVEWDYALREQGRDWPADAESMVGLKRLANLRESIEQILIDGVPGDIMETGVWRGGASIYMAGVLAAHGATDRQIWAADSFEGLPVADLERYPQDGGLKLASFAYLAVSLEQVRANFEKYDLLADNIHFLKGWFKDTMSSAPVDKLAILRLDGDMYESTMDVLTPMYHKLSPGGYLIVDDYNLEECERAITDFRRDQGITDEIHAIDVAGVYWRKSA
jgi:O-methyltransferase